MKTQNASVIGLVLALITLVMITAYSVDTRYAAATTIVASGKLVSEDVVALPSAQTCSTPVKHGDLGQVEAWINPTAVASGEYTAIIQQASNQSGPYMGVTPTTLSGSGTITTGVKATPVVWLAPARGLYTRVCFNQSTSVTETINLRLHVYNSEE